MLERLRSLAVFAEVVESGSFRAAARALGLSPSVVSHHLARLEAQLGVTLLYRSTRRMSLTPSGRRLYASCREMVAAARRGLDEVTADSATPSGELRITAPAMLAGTPFVGDVADFAAAFPKVRLSLCFDDRPRNLIEEGFDLAIRIGWLEDSSLKARKLLDMKVQVCASPGYLADRRRPEAPEDLASLDWVGLGMLPGYLDLTGPGGETRRIDCPARISVDSATAAKGLALEGMGLVPLLEVETREELADGRLVRVLPYWQPASPGVYAVWPGANGGNRLARRFVDFLAEQALVRRREDGTVPAQA